VCLSTVVGMIEHGIVEASSYTPSRVLSPTLRTVGDFVEVCYHDEKVETSSLNSQTQAAEQSSSVSSACTKQNGSTSFTWKTIEGSLMESCTNSDALTVIPCESGSLGNVKDVDEIVLGDESPLSSGDAKLRYGDDSPGVHSTHSKTGIPLSDTVTAPMSSKNAAIGISSVEITSQKTSESEGVYKTTRVNDQAGDVFRSSADKDSEADRTSTQLITASSGMVM